MLSFVGFLVSLYFFFLGAAAAAAFCPRLRANLSVIARKYGARYFMVARRDFSALVLWLFKGARRYKRVRRTWN